MGPSHPPPADCLDAEVVEDEAVRGQPPAIPQAHIPFAEGICRRAQMLERAAGPPEIAVSFEARDRTFACLDRVYRPTRKDIKLSQARRCKGVHLVQTN